VPTIEITISKKAKQNNNLFDWTASFGEEKFKYSSFNGTWSTAWFLSDHIVKSLGKDIEVGLDKALYMLLSNDIKDDGTTIKLFWNTDSQTITGSDSFVSISISDINKWERDTEGTMQRMEGLEIKTPKTLTFLERLQEIVKPVIKKQEPVNVVERFAQHSSKLTSPLSVLLKPQPLYSVGQNSSTLWAASASASTSTSGVPQPTEQNTDAAQQAPRAGISPAGN